MDKAKEDYSAALENFNKTQTLYYDADFPNTVNVRNKIKKYIVQLPLLVLNASLKQQIELKKTTITVIFRYCKTKVLTFL